MTIHKTKLLLSLLILSMPFSSAAQKRMLTMRDAVLGMTDSLKPESIKQPAWQPASHNFYRIVKKDKDDFLIKTHFPSGKTDTLESLPQLNKKLFGKDSLKGLPVFNWIDADYAYFNNGNVLYRGVLTGRGFQWSRWISLPEDAENLTVDKSMKLAYTLKNNLWMAGKDGTLIRVTDDADSNIINGQAVHRNEFGIEKGIFFSPQGTYLAYYRMDQSMVEDYPVVNWNVTPATVNYIKYPMAGRTSHQVHIKIFNPATKKSIELQTGAPLDHYLTSVTWSPDEKSVYIAILNRGQNRFQLNQYDVETGKKIKTLFEKSDEKYIEPQHPLSFLPGSKDEFIWWSREDGYWHLYLYNTKGRQIRQLTKGDFEVNEIVGFVPERQEVIFTAAKESPLEKHSYTVNWKTGAMRRLDKEPGVHSVIAAEDGLFVFDAFSSASVPKRSLVRSTAGNFEKTLLDASDPLKDFSLPEVKNIQLKADDGTLLYGKLILPADFNPNKKYPVIVYLYNGPHVQLIRNSFPESGNLWYDYLAQRGYIVFSMDGRGSSNRGKKFEQAVFRQLGTVEMNDQLKGVEYLKSLPFVDTAGMGVHGWSFGGFMTTSLMLRHPGVFKVGVAGGPVMDWKMYEVMYTERYMDTPEQNPEGYEQADLLHKAGNLKGKLLIIHGTNDPVVVWQHTIKFLKNSVDQKVQVDYFVYPGYEHNVRGKDRVHLMQKITDYFDEHLKK